MVLLRVAEVHIITAKSGMRRTYRVSTLTTSSFLIAYQGDVTGLNRARDTLLAEQRELTKQKPRGKTDEALISDITRLEANITVAKDDLVCCFFLFKGLSLMFHRGRASSASLASKTSSSTSTGN